MSTSIPTQGIQRYFKHSTLVFIFSIAFLPLPILFGGSFLREFLSRIQSILVFGFSAGDLLLMAGMLTGFVLLIIVPLAGFAWGQILAWTRRNYSSGTLLAYICLSFAYLVVSVVTIR